MRVIKPSIFPAGVCAAFSTRIGGVSPPPLGMNLSDRVGDDPERVKKNRALFFGGLGISLDRLAIPGQVHGMTVAKATLPGHYPKTDGLVTEERDVFLCVSAADCVPILLYDPVRQVVASVHAGWRGTATGIASAAIGVLTSEFGSRPSDIFVYIGPSASECCYVVGQEVAERFPSQFIRRKEDAFLVDLKGANRLLLLDAGVDTQKIEISPFCTISDAHLFHSHRRDGNRAGRMMGVIGLTAQS